MLRAVNVRFVVNVWFVVNALSLRFLFALSFVRR